MPSLALHTIALMIACSCMLTSCQAYLQIGVPFWSALSHMFDSHHYALQIAVVSLYWFFALHDAMHVCSQMDCWFMHFANVAYLSACSCMLACCKKQVLYAQHNLTYLPTTIMHEKQCWLTLLILSPTQNTSNMVELVKHDQCIPPPAGGQNI